MFKNIKPALIAIFILTLLVGGAVRYVQYLMGQPLDMEIPKHFVYNNTKIALAWTDDNTGEDLIIQSDRKEYHGFNEVDVYFSITNINRRDQDMDVVVWVGNEKVKVEKMERLETESAPKALSVLRTDRALGADSGASLNRKSVKGFTVGYAINDKIKSGNTNYYKATLKYPPMSKGEFFIEAFGGINRNRVSKNRKIFGNSVSYGHLDPWYSSNWSYRKRIDINADKVMSNETGFPVLATTTDTDLIFTGNGGKVASSTGADIVFTDFDGETLLNYEREKYDPSTGEIIYWIKTDISSTTGKTIYMYYGNAGASDLATTTGVWDDNYKMVQHLNEDWNASSTDSARYDNDGTHTNFYSATSSVDAQIDKGIDFDGADDFVEISHSDSLNISTEVTISAWAKKSFSSGTASGTAISNCADLQNMKNGLAGDYYLTKNINCSGFDDGDGKGFMPVGDDTNKFTGTFDGRGYQIFDLYINRGSSSWTGLFGYTDTGAEIKNVGLENVDITGNTHVGALVGFLYYGKVFNSYSSGSVKGSCCMGGLVGAGQGNSGDKARIDGSYSVCSVENNWSDMATGGLVGYPQSNITINNSYACGNVTSSGYGTGGLVGCNFQSSMEIYNSYSCGHVIGTGGGVGGLIGASSGTISNSYWDTETSGQASSAGGIGTTTAGMKRQGTFTNWDFDSIWAIEEDSTYAFAKWDENYIISKGRDAYSLQASRDGSIIYGYADNQEVSHYIANPEDWHYYSMAFNGTDLRLFIDGELKNTTNHTGTVGLNVNDLTIGGAFDTYFNGVIDEVRIFNTVRSAGWISTEYNNQSDVDSFLTFGAEEDSTPVEFVSTIMETGGDYSSLHAWENAVECDLIAARVFSGTGTGNLSADVTIELFRSAVYQNITAQVIATTSTQILVDNVSGIYYDGLVLQTGDQWRLASSTDNMFTVSGSGSELGDSAIAVAKIDGAWSSADTAAVAISGWTTSVTNYIRIYTTESARHKGKWDTEKYRLEVANSAAIRISVRYARIDGLQARITSVAGENNIVIFPRYAPSGNNEFWISNNIIRGITDNTHPWHDGIGLYECGSGIYKVWNNIIYDFSGSHTNSVAIDISDSDFDVYIYNNTIYNVNKGIYEYQDATTKVINNIVEASADGFIGSFEIDSDYNISNLPNDAPGSNSKNSTNVLFADEANDDFHLSSADTSAKDAGDSLCNDVNLPFFGDIDDEIRPAGQAWDIGADEYVGVTEFVATIMQTGGEYSSLHGWEAAIDCDLTASTTRVYNYTGAGYIQDGTAVTTDSGASIAMLIHQASSSQVLLINIAGSFDSGDVITDGTNSITLSNSGDSAIAVAKIDGAWTSADTTAVAISGWTTSASNYIRVYTTEAARHNGKWDSGKYRLETSSVLSIAENYNRFEGLQISYTGSGDDVDAINISGAGEHRISQSIIKYAGSDSRSGIEIAGATVAKIWNNIIYDFEDNGVNINNAGATSYIYNNTINNITGAVGGGIKNSAGTAVAKNNIVQDVNGDNYSGAFDNTSTHNISDDATYASSTADFVSANVLFADEANDDFHLAGLDTAARDQGTNLYGDSNLSFQNDIDGISRDARWDIGADEWEWDGADWYDTSYQCKRSIILQSSQIATTTSNFPVLATTTLADLKTVSNGGCVQNDNGYDIIFVDSDGNTLLNFEREKYNGATGEIAYWIKTDVSSTTDKTIYMYYGNSGASDLATTTGVWDDNYKMVQHLNEDWNASSTDSAQYNNDGTHTNFYSATSSVDAQIDKGIDFDGADDFVEISHSDSLNISTEVTISAWAKKSFSTGTASGTAITNCADLQNMKNVLAGDYYLFNNIDCSDTVNWNSGAGFEPVGDDWDNAFSGTFDGRGYQIFDLYINRGSSGYIGLFGYTDPDIGAEIKNVGLENVNITGQSNVGALVGRLSRGKILNSYSSGSVEGTCCVGGLVGTGYGSSVKKVRIDSSYSVCSVECNAPSMAVGGLIGYSESNIIINNSYACGNVTSVAYGTGGLVGCNFQSSLEIYNSYSCGHVIGTGGGVGGLVGSANGTITDSYWDTETSGQASSDGGTGTTTAGMKQQGTFTNWDFDSIWAIEEDSTYAFAKWDENYIISKGRDAYSLQASRDGSIIYGYADNQEVSHYIANPEDWHYYSMAFNGTDLKLFIDGELKNTTNHTGTVGLNVNDLTIGGAFDTYFNGIIDEVRIFDTVRSAGWIETEYNNQSDAGSFMSFGDEVCLSVSAGRSGGENVKVRIKGGTIFKGGVKF